MRFLCCASLSSRAQLQRTRVHQFRLQRARKTRLRKGLVQLALLAVGAMMVPKVVQADSLDHFGRGTAEGEARFASGTGNVIYLAAGTLFPLLEDGKEGEQHAVRTADALFTSTIVTEALKQVTRERRPDGSSRTSFPSGHATAAFAVATMESHYHPRQSLLWYSGAALISESRVQLNRHYLHDVVAGAAVGYFTARYELHSRHGLLLFPFVKGRDESGNAVAGFALSKTF